MDPIANMLTAIKNALAVGKKTITIPASKTKGEILKILKEKKYIEDFKIITKNKKAEINIGLKYQNNLPGIMHLKRISKPGLRTYAGYKKIPRLLGRAGTVIISTPGGILAGEAARKKKLGGEIICEVY